MPSGRVPTGPCLLWHLCIHKFHIPLTDIWDLVSCIALTSDVFSRPSVMSFIDIWELELWATQDPHETFKLCHSLETSQNLWFLLIGLPTAGHTFCFFLIGLGKKMTYRNWEFCQTLVLKVWVMTAALEEALPIGFSPQHGCSVRSL